MALAALTQSLGGGVGAFFDYGKGRKESLKVQAQAAALRPGCLAQSIQLATRVVAVESML